MSDVVSAGVPEVIVGQTAPAQSVQASFSGEWKDFAKDMAAIEAEATPVEPAQPEPLPAAATPQTEPAPTQEKKQETISVPEKFKTPEGSVDLEKMVKSYAEAEKKLKQLQNASKQPSVSVPQIPQVQPQQQAQAMSEPLTAFEAQVAQDLMNASAAAGQPMPQAYAVAQARIQVRLYEAAHQANASATFSKVSQFEQRLEEQARKDELTSLAKNAPWVVTPQGQAELERILGENQELLDKPDKWTRATKILIGERALRGSVPTEQVIPTPTGGQQIKPLPVTPVQPATNPVKLDTPEDVAKYVSTLSDKDEAEFWKKAGLKWDVPGTQFKGF